MSGSSSSNRRGLVLLATGLALAVGLVLGVGPSSLAPGQLAGVVLILLDAAPVLALLWLAALGYGLSLQRGLTPACRDRVTVALGLGLAALLLLHWLVGVTLGVGRWPAAAVCGIGVVLAVVHGVRWFRTREEQSPTPRRELPWTIALAGAPLGLILVAACCPPGTLWQVEAFGYDVLTYHLQLPRQWLEAGRITGDPRNVYSYLPSLVESGYAMIGALRGSVSGAAYACQLFHASLAVYAAVAVGRTVAGFVGAMAGGAAGAALLAVPWTMITASSAYNELAVIALGAAALLVLTDVSSERIGGAAAVGLLVGAATLSKLTAGPMIAVPIGLMLLLRLNPALRWRKPPTLRTGLRSLAVAAVVGLLTLSPYFIRNAVWTGNPVFPFATGVLGTGHWDAAQAERWRAAHGLDGDGGLGPLPAVARQWLFNTGYGAIGGKAVQTDATDIARFGYEGGFPALWVGVLLLGLAAVRPGVTRRLSTVMLIMLIAQAAFWLLATHQQSRFLLPLLLPTCVLIGLGLGRFGERTPRLRAARPLAAAALPVVLFTVSLSVLYGQTRALPDEDRARRATTPGTWVDAMVLFGRHPINDLPGEARVLLVADNGPLLYLRREVAYATPFDDSPLGEAVRETGDTPEEVIDALREAGFTHLWIGWSEYRRLRETHGYDPAVTPALLAALDRRLVRVTDAGHATLYAIPRP
ncbi:MAG: hypothetical protein GVY24_03870 [Planctomycetes bacterium]|nr:hypothetical protein [Planctomycetota bacterium]